MRKGLWNQVDEFIDMYQNREGCVENTDKPELVCVSSSITAQEILDHPGFIAEEAKKFLLTTPENLATLNKAIEENEEFKKFVEEKQVRFNDKGDRQLQGLFDYLKETNQSCLFEGGCKFFHNWYAKDEGTYDRIFDTIVLGIRVNNANKVDNS